jgi:hypothetical protein
MAYEFTHPKLNAWREWTIASTADGRSNARSSDIAVAHKVPLLFEPDEGVSENFYRINPRNWRSTQDAFKGYLFKPYSYPIFILSCQYYPLYHKLR